MMEQTANDLCASLRTLPGLRKAGDDSLRRMVRHGRRAVYRRQRALCYQSEPAHEAFLILKGTVARIMYRANDTSLSLGGLENGDWVGLCEALLDSVHLADAVASSATEVLVFSTSALGELRKIPAVEDHLLHYLAKSLFLLHSQIELNQPVPRIVQFLLSRAVAGPGDSAALTLTQDEIAQAVGLARETVNRHLQSLQSDGLLAVARGRIEIPDCAALKDRLLD